MMPLHENWRVLNSEKRKKIQPVKPLIDVIDKVVEKKNTAFDIGSGTGYYTLPLSNLFKRVFAVDINDKVIEILLKKLRESKIKNVGILISEKPPKIDFDIDFVLFANVLHEMDKEIMAEYISWSSKANSVCVVDWKMDSSLRPKHARLDKSYVERLLKEIGFVVKEVNLYEHHYVIFGIKHKVFLKSV